MVQVFDGLGFWAAEAG